MNTDAITGPAGGGELAGSGCVFAGKPCHRPGRHKHPYSVGTYGTKRCTCGSRHYEVAAGGPLPAKVSCLRCGRENYPATCYEAGRAHGPRLGGALDDSPAF